MTLLELNPYLRLLQLIPLFLIFCPLVKSYWTRKNKLNGLRRVRVALIMLVFALMFSTTYFFIFSLFGLSRLSPASQLTVFAEKVLNIMAYWLLFYMFSRARKHEK